ncbi:hypothetical protein D3C77_787630 [compost metagenome]
MAGRAIERSFIAQFRQTQAPGTDLHFANLPLAQTVVTTLQRLVGEVLGHETQRNQE